jgi:hypothetical protein
MGNIMQKSERKAFKALVKKNTSMNREMPVEDYGGLHQLNRDTKHGRNVSFNEKVRLRSAISRESWWHGLH